MHVCWKMRIHMSVFRAAKYEYVNKQTNTNKKQSELRIAQRIRLAFAAGRNATNDKKNVIMIVMVFSVLARIPSHTHTHMHA